MGKNKVKQQTKTSLKAAVAKTAKFKLKAKPVNSQLKQIKITNKDKTLKADKQLVELQDKIRQTTVAKTENSQSKRPKTKSLKNKTETDYMKDKQNSQETLNELNQMKLG